jgi:hypothetical protein
MQLLLEDCLSWATPFCQCLYSCLKHVWKPPHMAFCCITLSGATWTSAAAWKWQPFSYRKRQISHSMRSGVQWVRKYCSTIPHCCTSSNWCGRALSCWSTQSLATYILGCFRQFPLLDGHHFFISSEINLWTVPCQFEIISNIIWALSISAKFSHYYIVTKFHSTLVLAFKWLPVLPWVTI